MNFLAAGLLIVCAGLFYALRHQMALKDSKDDALTREKTKTALLQVGFDAVTKERDNLQWELDASTFMLETAIHATNLGDDFKIPLPQDHERKKKVKRVLQEIEAVKPASIEENEFVEIYDGHHVEPVDIVATGPIPLQRDAGNGQAYFKKPA